MTEEMLVAFERVTPDVNPSSDTISGKENKEEEEEDRYLFYYIHLLTHPSFDFLCKG